MNTCKIKRMVSFNLFILFFQVKVKNINFESQVQIFPVLWFWNLHTFSARVSVYVKENRKLVWLNQEILFREADGLQAHNCDTGNSHMTDKYCFSWIYSFTFILIHLADAFICKIKRLNLTFCQKQNVFRLAVGIDPWLVHAFNQTFITGWISCSLLLTTAMHPMQKIKEYSQKKECNITFKSVADLE